MSQINTCVKLNEMRTNFCWNHWMDRFLNIFVRWMLIFKGMTFKMHRYPLIIIIAVLHLKKKLVSCYFCHRTNCINTRYLIITLTTYFNRNKMWYRFILFCRITRAMKLKRATEYRKKEWKTKSRRNILLNSRMHFLTNEPSTLGDCSFHVA